jgi:hypothetical protein
VIMSIGLSAWKIPIVCTDALLYGLRGSIRISRGL